MNVIAISHAIAIAIRIFRIEIKTSEVFGSGESRQRFFLGADSGGRRKRFMPPMSTTAKFHDRYSSPRIPAPTILATLPTATSALLTSDSRPKLTVERDRSPVRPQNKAVTKTC